MKTKMLTLAMAVFSLVACKNEPMKPQEGYIGPSDIKVEDGRMSPEVLLSFGRLSDPQLSPDGKTILYGVSYTSIADNRSVRNLFTIPAEGGEKTQLTMDGKSISNARWSPDGDAIYFLQGGQVWKAPYKAGKLGKRTQVTNVENGIGEFTLSPDGGQLMFVSPVKSSVEITALYYPGTEHMPEWDMVKQVVPQARPLLAGTTRAIPRTWTGRSSGPWSTASARSASAGTGTRASSGWTIG